MGNAEIPKWLKGLPLAPEFRPTDTEFADPIAYISKIEKEASAFGICKVIPPLPRPSKRYVFNNVNKSLLNARELGLGDVDVKDLSKRVRSKEGGERAVFTTRQQELGQTVGRGKGEGKKLPQTARKQVWQSGEVYTLDQFEAKAKGFSRSVLGTVKEVSPIEVEALFWKAALEKPIYVEYANDVPGSGFGEPEGLLGFFHPRKRRRITGQCQRGRSYYAKYSVNTSKNDCSGVEGQAFPHDTSSSSKEGKGIIGSPSTSYNEALQSNESRDDVELEGTAGWKLSNSPWNLQAITRSAGSLTRFMLDNIPGVTSPMVYIGMLFSWFAWHIEDHELHSLNFMHTGSPKTWYGIPGDYAFAFEDVIRKKAYGGEFDHLAALKLLGEKTTLLSPEMIVRSGIPCCRLIQNPGEYVVSFPRAYHVGFSHGFNCGEAANFGTPQWLTIAKEAAVRRTAMDHLPMLSHQQLLYLLTMSFVSRVPESLLPGVRSSRLRDRLKDGREFSVKKAFIDDVLKENSLLSSLREKDSVLRVVLWHPDSLPSFAREVLVPKDALCDNDAEVAVAPNESPNQDINQITLHRETVDDLYLGSDDLSHDFQIDSGTVPCVACGILGYPFMSVVQPSEKSSLELFPAEHHPAIGVDSPQEQDDKISVSACNYDSWNAFGVLRPRIFCLEHAVQIKELLRPKGGVKVLVICHSEYEKIKANAFAIAEEFRIPFNYKEVQLDTATEKELKLIDTTVDSEQLSDLQEDWTSKLGINLRYSARKGFLSKKIEHTLNLDHLLSAMAPISRISSIKWWSRKTRSKSKTNRQKHKNICSDDLPKKDEKILQSAVRMEKSGKVLLQYYRKKYRTQI
ncbi:lysine-specific demethylase ELF6 isoform X2 [Silene latifolia]|uniref:lysine-specific demethylase ELF6 isoform X2 n=1 Tax=Silene latifolia TaxID=37657 RepID=UPI003D785E22